MPKWCLTGRCPRIKIRTYFVVALCLLIAYRIAFYGYYNYDYVDRKVIDAVLYKKAHNAVMKKGRPSCTYSSILQSTKTINTWDVPKIYYEFDAHGIADGSYAPHECNPLFSVAIIITYRNRQKQLDIFLPYIHNFLRKQNIHYKLYLIEQQDETPWNKGLLYNLGARQAMRDNFPCLILHDVDLVPLDESNLYVCTVQPRHLSASIDKFRFVLPYLSLVGGVVAITSNHFEVINGFSNRFLGWGGEDDDFALRMDMHNLTILRFPREMSRYTMLPHRPQPHNPRRGSLLREHAHAGAAAAAADGLRSPVYRSLHLEPHRLFTLVRVHL